VKIGIIGQGFIGYHLAEFFHSTKNEVYAWSNFLDSTPWQTLGESYSEPKLIDSLDVLIVASGKAKPGILTLEDEIASTITRLNRLKPSGHAKVIYISSGSVYGETEIAARETHLALPSTEYGAIKLHLEGLIHRDYGPNSVNLRIGNIVDFNNPTGIFKELLLSSSNPVFYGEKRSCRDYIEMKSLSNAIIELLALQKWPKALNIGSGVSTSLLEIEEMFLTSHRSFTRELTWLPQRNYDVCQTKLDVTLAHTLGLSKIDSAINKLIDYL
jgi:nucleoside-diphosphate-sugar epimerase